MSPRVLAMFAAALALVVVLFMTTVSNRTAPLVVNTHTIKVFQLASPNDSIVYIKCGNQRALKIHYPAKLDWVRQDEKDINGAKSIRILVSPIGSDETVFAMSTKDQCAIGHVLPEER